MKINHKYEAAKQSRRYWIRGLQTKCSCSAPYMCNRLPRNISSSHQIWTLCAAQAPSYLAIQKFSDPPKLSDLDGFALEADDIKELKNCQPGRCNVQLPTEAMESFKQSVDWSAPDAANQANRLARRMALEALQGYLKGGNAALGTYRDKHHPTVVADTFRSLLSRSKALPVYLPDLERYLLDFPDAKSESVESEFYWEKVNFGLKPTLRIVQAIVYRGTRPTDPAYAVVVKQLYASHYFETALDLTVCVRDQGASGSPRHLPDYPQGFTAGGSDWIERGHCEEGGC